MTLPSGDSPSMPTDGSAPLGSSSAASRAGWSLADQALSTLTNFALIVVAARSVTPADFGSFALILATYVLFVGVSRALVSEPLVVTFSAAGHNQWREAARASVGTSAGIALALAIPTAATAVVLDNAAVSAQLLVFALLLPGLLVQDALRYAFVAGGRPRSAFANDAVWTAGQFFAFAGVLTFGRPEVNSLMAAWGGAATLAASVGLLQVRFLPDPRVLASWLSTHRRLAGPFLLEFFARQGAGLVALYAVGAVAGLAAAGSLRAAQAVFGPLTVVFLGVGLAVTPELVRLRSRKPERLPRVAAVLGGTLALIALGWGLVAMTIPDRWGQALFGATWVLASPLLLFVTIEKVANGASAAALAGLRALARAWRSLAAAGLISVAVLIAGVTGAYVHGAQGAAAGTALVSPFATLVWWAQFRTAARPVRASR